LIQEYLEIFAGVLGMDAVLIEEWRLRFERDSRVTVVRLGRRYTESRDPDDNVLLAIAASGKARYLVTNDRDLLELPPELQHTLPFAIRRPQDFLQDLEEDRRSP
jgi:predicted nucleic acid-binding protein